jgi:hypothetical protein
LSKPSVGDTTSTAANNSGSFSVQKIALQTPRYVMSILPISQQIHLVISDGENMDQKGC